MSGHSKWSTIKRKKGAADQKRGKEFSKLIKVISSAAREGGSDPDSNAKLRSALDKAKAINMPKETITNAVKRGAGEIEGVVFMELNYEGYGPAGVALIIECVTDNRNRTTADVRHALTKYGGSMGATGCVQWMFDKKGLILVSADGVDEDAIMEVTIDAGADEVVEEDGFFRITCDPADFEELKKALESANFKIEDDELSMEPQTMVKVDKKQAATTLKLLEMLEDLEDVQNVYSNFDIPEDVMAELDL